LVLRRIRILAGLVDAHSQVAPGFTVEQMVELVRAGLATAKAEHMRAGGRAIEVTRVRITEAGRQALVQ
jgi:hypothetical protein